MICKKDSQLMAVRAMEVPNQKCFYLSEYLMKATIIAAGIIACNIIVQNITVFSKHENMSGSYQMLLLGIVIFGCCVRCIVDEFILSSFAQKKREDTLLCGKMIRTLSNEELVKLFIIEGCPEVKGVQLQDKAGVCLRGRHTMHYVEFGKDGAIITSQKKDYRADVEANAIMRCLVKACN